jgi:hypothetical protein
MQSALRRPDGRVDRDLSVGAMRAAFQNPDVGTLWVDLDVSDDAQAALLTDVFHSIPSPSRTHAIPRAA